MKRGDLFRVYRGAVGDPREFRVFVLVSRQVAIDSRFSTVTCAPVYSVHNDLSTQVEVGVPEGLKHDSSIHCDELISIPKSLLTDYLGHLSDEMIDQLESSLKRYELKSASKFRKTPIQANPLDFPSIKNTEVFTCDLVMGYPASLDFLRTYIAGALKISTGQLAVYSENDPRQIETDLFIDRNSEEYKKKYKSRLGSEYEEAEKVKYGEEYNTSFLKELEKVSKERAQTLVHNELSPEQKIDHTTLPKDYNSVTDSKKDDVGLFGRIKKVDIRRAGAK